MFSIGMNNCILASSSSLVLGNCASQFVNNLSDRTGFCFGLLPHEQEHLSETAIER